MKRRMKKRLLGMMSFFVAVCLCFSVTGLPRVSVKAEILEPEYDGFEYEEYTEYIALTKYIGNDKNVIVPDEIYGKRVTSVKEGAFSGNATVESIVFPDNIKRIGRIEDCSELKRVVIPENYDYLAERLYIEDCPKLEEVNHFFEKEGDNIIYKIPSKEFTGKVDFSGCSRINIVEMPENMQEIPDQALYTWNNVKEVRLPDTVTKIGKEAFAYCSNLEKINLPDGLAFIEGKAFSNCRKLTEILLPESLRDIKVDGFEGTGITSAEIPSECQLGEGVFSACSNLKDITIRGKDITITPYMLRGCGNLENIYFPDGMEKITIGDFAFDYDEKLKTLDGVLNQNGDQAQLIISSKIKSMGRSVFNHCTQIKQVKFQEDIKEIPEGALGGVQEIHSVQIPEGVKKIGDRVFSNCSGLETVEIPKSVTFIGNQAFYGCAIKEIKLPEQLESIGNGAFSFCKRLKNIYVPGNIKTIGMSVFSYCDNLETAVIDCKLRSGMFSDCGRLKKVTLNPDIENEIPYNTFVNDSGLEVIENADTITAIGEYALYGCKNLRQMGSWIVQNETSKVLNISDRVREIGEKAFSHTGITKVNFGGKRTSLQNIYLTDVDTLDEITMTSSITVLEKRAFEKNRILKKVQLSPGIKVIPEKCFAGCRGLEVLVIPEGVERIEDYAFENIMNLSVYMPYSVKYIAHNLSSIINQPSYMYVYANTPAHEYAKNHSDKYGLKGYYIRSPLLDRVEIVAPTKKIYVEGETFQIKGLKVITYYRDGSKKILNDYKLVKPDIRIGVQKGKISCLGYEKTFDIKVYPKAVSGVKAKSSKRKTVAVTWNKVSGSSYYKIYRATSKNGKYIYKKKIKASSARKYINTRLKSGKKYYYKVYACKTVKGKEWRSRTAKIVSAKSR